MTLQVNGILILDDNRNLSNIANLSVSGPVTLSSSLTVTGNTTFSGNVTTINAENLTIKDNMIYLNSESAAVNPDLGITGNYNDGVYRHTGIFRDATDGVWKVFDQYVPEPDSSIHIDTSDTTFRYADFQANTVYSNSLSSNTLNLNAGTGNGVLYLNSSKNVVSGSSLVFDGSNLGIGTSSPGAKLTVKPNSSYINFTQGRLDSANNIRIEAAGTTATYLEYRGYLGHIWDIDSSEHMRLTSTGLGIGTTSFASGSKLAVQTSSGKLDIRSYGELSVKLSSSAAFGYNATNNSHIWEINDSEKMRLNTSGNLGIGLTPSAWGSSYKAIQINNGLSLMGSNVNGNFVSNAYFDESYWRYIQSGVYSNNFYVNYGNNGSFVWSIAPIGNAGDVISYTEAMTLNSSGNLGIGTTSPSARLHIAKSGGGVGPSNIVYVDSTSSYGGITLNSISGQNCFLELYQAGTTKRAEFGLDSTNNAVNVGGFNGFGLGLYSNGSKVALFDVYGNLGVGITSNLGTNGKVSIYESTYARLFLTDSTLGNSYGGQVRGWGQGGAGGQLELGTIDANVWNSGIRIYNQATAITFSTNSGSNGSTTERVRIDSSGNLLVGASSAVYSASNRGNISINGSSSAVLGLSIGGTASGYFYTDSNSVQIGSPSSKYITFDINGERARIDTSGNFSIGTTSSVAKLSVNGSIQSIWGDYRIGTVYDNSYRQGMYFDVSNRNLVVFSTTNDSGGNIIFKTRNGTGSADNDYGSERVRITSSGNVGIGTTSPAYKLQVSGQSNIGQGVAQANPSATDILSTAHVILGGYGGNYLTLGQTTSFTQWLQSSYQNPTTATYHLSLQPLGGNVGIGTLTPTHKLEVAGTGNFTGALTENGYQVLHANNYTSYIAGVSAVAWENITNNPFTTSSGNIGLGTSSILGNSTFNANLGVVARTAAGSGIVPYLQLYNGNASTDLKTWRIGGETSGNLAFGTVNDAYNASTVRMSLDTNGALIVGGTSRGNYGGQPPISVLYQSSISKSDADGGTQVLYGTSAFGSDTGAATTYGFKYNTAGNYATSVRVRGAKENATDGNYSGYLGFDTRSNGGNLTERMRIDSSGNVGIGTSSPDEKLMVAGAIRSTSNANNFAASAGAIFDYYNGTARIAASNGSTSGIMYLDNIGNFGVGASAPQWTAHFHTSSGNPTYVGWTNSDTGSTNNGRGFQIIFNPASANYQTNLLLRENGPMGFWTNNTERLRIDASGNVGIGTSNPGSKIDVVDANIWTSGSTIKSTRTQNQNNTVGKAIEATITSYGSPTAQTLYAIYADAYNGASASNSTYYGLYVNRGDIALGVTSGNVGIGTISPSQKLQVVGAIAATGQAPSLTSSSAFFDYIASVNSARFAAVSNSTSTTAPIIFSQYSSNGSIGRDAVYINSSGNVGIGTNSPSCKLNVSGVVEFDQSVGSQVFQTYGSNVDIHIRPSSGNGGWLTITENAVLDKWSIGCAAGDSSLQFNSGYITSSTRRMTLTSGGTLLLGTPSAIGSAKTVITKGVVNAITAEDANNTSHLTLAGSDSLVRLQLGVGGNNLAYSGWIQASYDNTGGSYGVEPILLNPLGGNVGVGTTAPAYKLDVNGSTYIGGTLYFPSDVGTKIRFYNGPTSLYGIDVQSSELRIYSGAGGTSTGGITFGKFDGTTYSESVRITNAGNVGIGTTTASAKVEIVSGSPSTTNALSIKSNAKFVSPDGNSYITARMTDYGALTFSSTAGQLFSVTNSLTGTLFAINDISGMPSIEVLDTGNIKLAQYDGNVGIGTSSPSAKLHISGTSADGTPLLRVNSTAAPNNFNWCGSFMNSSLGSSRNTILLIGQAESSKNSGYIGFNHSGTSGSDTNFLTFGVFGNDNLLNIRANGNVGVGTTSPSEKLHVSGTVRVDGGTGVRIFRDGASSITSHLYLANSGNTRAYNWNLNSSGDGLDFWTFDGSSWSNKITYLANGNVGIGTTSPGTLLHLYTRGDSAASPNKPSLTIHHADINAVGTGGSNGGILKFYNQQQNNTGWSANSIWGRIDFYGSQPTSGSEQLGASILAACDGGSAGTRLNTFLAFYTSDATAGGNNVERLRIDSAGNVGIGVTPSNLWGSGVSALQIGSAGNLSSAGRYTAIQAGLVASSPGYAWKFLTSSYGLAYLQDTTDGNHSWYGTSAAGTATNTATPTQYMVLDKNGNLGIGNTAPSVKLHVTGSSIIANNSGINPDSYQLTVIAGAISDGNWGISSGIGGNAGTGKSWAIGHNGGYLYCSVGNNTSNQTLASYMVVGGTTRNLWLVPTSGGNVGIGIAEGTAPSYKLQVNGSFAATSKSFLIDHPTKEGMKLRYGSLESPYHGVRLTGEAVITDETLTVNLPEYIHGLCKQEGSQVQITNIKHGKVIWVEDIDIENDTFTVALDRDISDKKEYKFYWSFTAIRKDIEEMIVEFNDGD